MAPPAAPARSAPPSPARRAHGPGPECGRAPRPGHGLGAPGGAGGGRGPSALMPGPARGGRLGDGRSATGARVPRPRRWGCGLGGAAAGAPAAALLLGSSSPLRGSALLCSAPGLRPPPSQPGLRQAGPRAHVTSACEHAPRGPRPRPAPAPWRSGASPPRPCPLPACPLAQGRRGDPGAEGGARFPVASASRAGVRAAQPGPGRRALGVQPWVLPETCISPRRPEGRGEIAGSRGGGGIRLGRRPAKPGLCLPRAPRPHARPACLAGEGAPRRAPRGCPESRSSSAPRRSICSRCHGPPLVKPEGPDRAPGGTPLSVPLAGCEEKLPRGPFGD
ncbi:uncharacterized protein [Tursiops truncatus]|uniref:uncharacterized protein n=1 Tax=Tursiops truncatus TaxID=9739 RepID=UPI003CCF4565